MWAQEKTIPEIAKAVGRVGKGDDPYHSLRVPEGMTGEKTIHETLKLLEFSPQDQN
jgi:hypothetical protein